MAHTAGLPRHEALAAMDVDAALRALHVVAVVLWIGGVGLVTTALLPAASRRPSAEEGLALFEAVERRFAPQARIATLVAGVTGFARTWRLDLWHRFSDPAYWWMHAMVGLWAVFMVLLFVVDPFILHRVLHRIARRRPAAAFRLLQVMHWLLLLAGLATIAGTVAGAHGGLVFG
jgi:uncharacterized membrane protein